MKTKRTNKESPTPKEQGFYNKNAWKRARTTALSRDNHLCQRCLREKRIATANTVHHVKPTATHPELALELSNLESLCRECHEAVHEQKKPEPTYPARVIKA